MGETLDERARRRGTARPTRLRRDARCARQGAAISRRRPRRSRPADRPRGSAAARRAARAGGVRFGPASDALDDEDELFERERDVGGVQREAALQVVRAQHQDHRVDRRGGFRGSRAARSGRCGAAPSIGSSCTVVRPGLAFLDHVPVGQQLLQLPRPARVAVVSGRVASSVGIGMVPCVLLSP